MKRAAYPYLYKRISLCIIVIVVSCKKEAITTFPVASLTVTNAIVGASLIRVGSIVTPVANNNYGQLNIKAGENELYIWPTGDSAHPYLQYPKFYAEERGVYSLFLAGQLPNVTGIVIQDTIPYHSDSTCGIRFINLSPNSPPVNITLSTSTPTATEVSNLAYLQYTGFKLYSARAANTSYSFQVRKASDNTLLTGGTITLSTPRFTNITLVIRGMVGTNLGILSVKNDR